MKLKNIFGRLALRSAADRFSFVLLGVILGACLFNLKAFTFDWSLDAVKILTIFFTFIITFNLQHALTHRAGDDRIEKAMIMEQAKKVERRVEGIGLICRESCGNKLGTKEALNVISDFKALNNELSSLEALMILTNMEVDMDKFKEVRAACLLLKRSATSGNFPYDEISVPENATTQAVVNDALAKLFRLIFYINRR